MKEDVEVLREVPIFASVDPGKLKLLAFASQRLVFDEGQILCKEGDRGEQAFVIVKGAADVFVRAGGNRHPCRPTGPQRLRRRHRHPLRQPRTATVKAASRCETLVIGKSQLMGLLKSFPEMGIAMMRVLAQRLERTSHALAEAQRRNASVH